MSNEHLVTIQDMKKIKESYRNKAIKDSNKTIGTACHNVYKVKWKDLGIDGKRKTKLKG